MRATITPSNKARLNVMAIITRPMPRPYGQELQQGADQAGLGQRATDHTEEERQRTAERYQPIAGAEHEHAAQAALTLDLHGRQLWQR